MSHYMTLPAAESHWRGRFPKVSKWSEYARAGNLPTDVRGDDKMCQTCSEVLPLQSDGNPSVNHTQENGFK